MGTVAVYCGRLSSALAQALALVILAREVEPSIVGILSVAVSLVGLCGLIADQGFEPASLRSRASGEIDASLSFDRLHRVSMVMAAAVVAAVVLWGHFVLPTTVPLSFLLLSGWIYVERRNSLALSLAIAVGREVRAGTSLGVSRVGTLVAYAALTWIGIGGPQMRYLLFLIAAAILSQVLIGSARPRTGGHPHSAGVRLRDALTSARPYWIASISGQARTMDVVVVGALGSPLMAGLYAFPARAVGPFRLAATSISVVAMPRAAKGDWAQVRALERSMWGVLGLFLGGIVFVWAWGEEVSVRVLGDAYADVGEILAILMLGVLFNIPGALWSGILQGSGSQHTVAKVGLWLVPAYYLFIIVGLSLGGVRGAACGVSATFLLQFLIMLKFRFDGRWAKGS